MINNEYRRTNYGMKLKNDMAHFLKHEQENQFNLFVTLNAFKDYKFDTLQSRIRCWESDVTSRLFRGTKYKTSFDNDFRYWGFAENTNINDPHYHLVMYITPQRIDWFKKVAPKIWSKKIPSGQCHIKEIRDYGCIDYVLKNFDKPFGYQNYIVSGEFRNRTIH